MPNINASAKRKWKSVLSSLHFSMLILLSYCSELYILLVWILFAQLLVLVQLFSSHSYFLLLLATCHPYMLGLCVSLQALFHGNLVCDLQNWLPQLDYWYLQSVQIGNLCFKLILSQLSIFVYCVLFFIFLHFLRSIVLLIQ